MKNEKNEAKTQRSSITLKSYFLSLFCMVLCCAMFMGTTFAWFSAEVTSSANQIQVGALQVSLLHHTDSGLVPVTSTHKVFDSNVQWKPNHVELAVLTVKNLGDLAFDYKLQMEADSAGCVLSDGVSFADVASNFEVYIYHGDAAAATQDLSDPAWSLLGTLAQVTAGKISVTEGKMKNIHNY